MVVVVGPSKHFQSENTKITVEISVKKGHKYRLKVEDHNVIWDLIVLN